LGVVARYDSAVEGSFGSSPRARSTWGSIACNRDLARPEVGDQEINAILLAATPDIGF
jgi:hypothetical protein